MDDYKHFFRLLLCFFLFIFLNSTFTTAQARTFNFQNNCTFPVWFGFSGLGNPKPANNNYKLEPNGGKSSVTIGTGTQSGAIAGRTNCTSSGCETADCGGGTGPCKTGFSQPATQAEFTVISNGTDWYDVSVINGINLPVSITPSVASKASDPYFCGSPGTITPSPGLGRCSWQFNPPLVEYNWVQSGGNACSSDKDCSSGKVCGLSFNAGQSQLLKKTCGKRLGYWTANQICGVQRNYGAPFYCNKALPPPQSNLTTWNLLACVGMGSCYQSNADSTCCGCVNWDTLGLPVPPPPTTHACYNKNPTWVSNALPTLDWLKKACPTVYTYPYDDPSSTFVCRQTVNNVNQVSYTITFCPNGATPPPTDTGTIKVVAASSTSSQCSNATDTFYVDQNAGQTFKVSNGISKVVGVGKHQLRLASSLGIPGSDSTQPGKCTSTLSQTEVDVVKNQTTQVTATYRFEPEAAPSKQFSYNVILGYPFLKVIINGSQPCPGSNGAPTCLVDDQAVNSILKITGYSKHLCNLEIQEDGNVEIGANSNYCNIVSTPATRTRPGSISLPANF